jgi:uncharacterized membrane protein
MKWYLSIIAWIADAIKRKAELDKDVSIDARLERIENKLDQIKKYSIPVAVFAAGFPIYLIGLGGLLKNGIEATGIEWNNLLYLGVGIVLVIWSLLRLPNGNRKVSVILALTIASFVVIGIFSLIRLT